MEKIQAFLTLVSFALAMLILSVFIFFPDHIETLWREDSVVEFLQSFFYLISAFAQIFLSYSYLGRPDKRRRGIFHLLLFILFLTVGMEEISWGQRIFGWETPPLLEDVNLQNETNIHNLFSGVFSPLHLSIVLFINLFCYFLPLLHHISRKARDFLGGLQVPVVGINMVSVFILADLLRPVDINSLDTQLTILIFTLPLGLYLSKKLSGVFAGIYMPQMQVSCIFIMGISYLLFGIYGPQIPTLWIWESRELLFAIGFMFFSFCEVKSSRG